MYDSAGFLPPFLKKQKLPWKPPPGLRGEHNQEPAPSSRTHPNATFQANNEACVLLGGEPATPEGPRRPADVLWVPDPTLRMDEPPSRSPGGKVLLSLSGAPHTLVASSHQSWVEEKLGRATLLVT